MAPGIAEGVLLIGAIRAPGLALAFAVALVAGCGPADPSRISSAAGLDAGPAIPDLPPPPAEVLRAQMGMALPEGFVRDGTGRIHGRRDGAEVVLVPAGAFDMGTDGERMAVCSSTLDGPRHNVTLGAFLVDRCPVTVGQWRRFEAATAAPSPSRIPDTEDDRMPASADFAGAARYAAWAGRSLPTEAQWEKAARGTDGRLLPWGDEERDFPEKPQAAGALPWNASPYGVLDMAGGPYEWCRDFCGPSAAGSKFIAPYEDASPRVEPSGPPTGPWRIARNGFFENSSTSPKGIYVGTVVNLTLYTSTRNWRRPMDSSSRNWGREDDRHAFRCVVRLER